MILTKHFHGLFRVALLSKNFTLKIIFGVLFDLDFVSTSEIKQNQIKFSYKERKERNSC